LKQPNKLDKQKQKQLIKNELELII